MAADHRNPPQVGRVLSNDERRKERGISKKQDERWQKLALVPQEQFEEALAAPAASVMYLFHLGAGEDFAGLNALGDESLNVGFGFGNFSKGISGDVSGFRKQCRVYPFEYFDCLTCRRLTEVRQPGRKPSCKSAFVPLILEQLLGGGKRPPTRAMLVGSIIPGRIATMRCGTPLAAKPGLNGRWTGSTVHRADRGIRGVHGRL